MNSQQSVIYNQNMQEVDEMLLEQDLLSPTGTTQNLKNLSKKGNKENEHSSQNRVAKRAADSSPDMARVNGSGTTTKSNGGSGAKESDRQVKLEKLRDSTLEKLLNGEKDLKDLFGMSKEDLNASLSQEEKQSLKKKLSSSLKEHKDRFGGSTATQDGTDMEGDELDMRDLSEDLNQLLENYEDFVNNGDGRSKKVLKSESGEQNNNAKDVDEDWVFSPVKNKKFAQEGANGKSANYGTVPNKKPTTADQTSSKQQSTKAQAGNTASSMGRTESDEIDSLVEEELSRNESEQASQRAIDDLETKVTSKPTINTNLGSAASSHAGTPVGQSMMRVQISSKSITAENAAGLGSRGSVGSANGTKNSKQATGDGNDSVGGSSTGSGAESSSQMFKDLFSTSAHAKTKGIAGAFEAGGMPDRGDSRGDSRRKHMENKTTTQLEDDLLIDPLLAAVDGKESGNQLLQISGSLNATLGKSKGKKLNKDHSKKDLKNKFKSSSAIYKDGQKEGEENEDDEDTRGDLDDNDGGFDDGRADEDDVEMRQHRILVGLGVAGGEEEKNISDILKRHIQKEEMIKSAVANNKVVDEKDIDELIKQHLEEEKQLRQDDTAANSTGGKRSIKLKGQGADADPDDDEEDDDEDDIEDETLKKKKKLSSSDQVVQGSKLTASAGSEPMDDDEDAEGYDYLDDALNMSVKSPKTTLIEHLRLLADIFNSSLDEASEYYDQIFDERVQFMLDFENILKIMTFDETVEYVLPCMQIYSSEQDYLKLKLFQNLEKLFKKLFKAEVFVPKAEIIDIITINIFPLASRMLMLSEEPVQVEGVEALLNLSKQYIPKEQSQNLVMKVIQVIMDRISTQSEHQESEDVKEKAKIAILIIVQKFAEASIFEKDQCKYFLEHHLEDICENMLFKIKKFLLPALIAISPHLSYDVFVEKVYNDTFKQFNTDEIWGVRKVCIEHLPNLLKHLKGDDKERLNECIDFFQRCLVDTNRWVKNQALVQFGPLAHNFYLKLDSVEKENGEEVKKDKVESKEKQQEDSEKDAELKQMIDRLCKIYYDMKMVFGSKAGESDLDSSLMLDKLDEYSFMQNTKSDDVDKVKYHWAFNLPCALLVNGKSKFWFAHAKAIYELLYKDILLNLRTTISASFKEVIEILEIDKMEDVEERRFFVDVLNHFLKDTEEIQAKVLPTLCTLVSKFAEEEKTELLDSLIRAKIESIKTMKNARDNMIKMLEQLFEIFPPTQLLEAGFHEYLFDIIKEEKAVSYKSRAASVLGSKIIAPLIKGKKYRAMLTTFTDELRTAKNFRARQLYVEVATSTFTMDKEIFKKHFAKNIAADLESEKCRCVHIALARLCETVPDGYSKSLDKVRQKLLVDNDSTVLQYMPTSGDNALKAEKDRRYLSVGYGSSDSDKDNAAMTEEEWLAKEKKEIEEVEKTVTIRFANYSTLMRAQALTQGLSAQLAMFLSSMGVSNAGATTGGGAPGTLLGKATAKEALGSDEAASKDGDPEFNKKLFEKAGISPKEVQKEHKEQEKATAAKLRSLSPLGMLEEDAPSTILAKKNNGDLAALEDGGDEFSVLSLKNQNGKEAKGKEAAGKTGEANADKGSSKKAKNADSAKTDKGKSASDISKARSERPAADDDDWDF